MTYETSAVDHAVIVRKLDTALDALARLRRLMADALIELDALRGAGRLL